MKRNCFSGIQNSRKRSKRLLIEGSRGVRCACPVVLTGIPRGSAVSESCAVPGGRVSVCGSESQIGPGAARAGEGGRRAGHWALGERRLMEGCSDLFLASLLAGVRGALALCWVPEGVSRGSCLGRGEGP